MAEGLGEALDGGGGRDGAGRGGGGGGGGFWGGGGGGAGAGGGGGGWGERRVRRRGCSPRPRSRTKVLPFFHYLKNKVCLSSVANLGHVGTPQEGHTRPLVSPSVSQSQGPCPDPAVTLDKTAFPPPGRGFCLRETFRLPGVPAAGSPF
jgi:hypothetical protein